MKRFVRLVVATLLFAVGVLLCQQPQVVRAATVRKVYTNGTSGTGDTTYTLAQLQDAIDDAAANDACGSEILLEQDADFTASGTGFALKPIVATPTWDCITLRTGVDSSGTVLSSALFPADGARMTTGYRSVLAKLTPGANNEASLRTVFPSEVGGCSPTCVASGWTVKWLEFDQKADWPMRGIVRLGTMKDMADLPGGNGQDTLAEVPQYLSFVQNDVHGGAFTGQWQGLLLATKDARIRDNSFTDFKSLNETQAITVWNAVGPFDVSNNLIEASTENFLTGGSDTYLRLQATVTGSPTTTSLPLASPVWVHSDATTQAASFATDIYSGIYIAVEHAGTTYGNIECTFSGSTCTVPTLPFTPTVGDVVRWTYQLGGLSFKYNYVRKPLEWFNPILPTVGSVTAVAGTSGSLAAATYCYRVVSRAFVSGSPTPNVPSITSAASPEVCQTTSGTAGSVTVAWAADANAGEYRVYARASGAQNVYFTVTTGACCTFTDTGAAGTAGTPPTAGTIWFVKNNFELKGCDGRAPAGPCVVEGNVFDRAWCCSQNNIISLKVNNQNHNDVSATLRNLTFRDNWIRSGNRGLALTCTSTGNAAPEGPSGVMTDVTITNNLWTDLASTWTNTTGTATNSAIIVTTGNAANVGLRGCVRLTISHNTFLATTGDMNGPMWINLNTSADKMVDLVVRDNIMARDCIVAGCISNGVRTLKGFAPNNLGNNAPATAWTGTTTGASAADHNAWPDGTSAQYLSPPFTNAFFPADATLKSAHLVNFANCNGASDVLGCGLLASSDMKGAASDGGDLGINAAVIKAKTDVALGTTATPAPELHHLRWRLRIRGGTN